MRKSEISSLVIHRMPRYYRCLERLRNKGIDRISSRGLGIQSGLTPSVIRQDLSSFGEFGQQGIGYCVEDLLREIVEILGMNNGYTAVIVGAGKLGNGLMSSFPFETYGINVISFYDTDPEIVGTTVFGAPVHHISELAAHLTEHPVDIGILTEDLGSVDDLTKMFSEGGVKGIWNFTNTELKIKGEEPVVENVHLFDSFFSLCCSINGYGRRC